MLQRAVPNLYRLLLIILVALQLGLPGARAEAWERPHSDGTNSGLLDVKTLAAKTPSATIQDIGSFYPGAGPVVAADGTVYLANVQGKLMALRPDGKPYWNREITHGQSILASPVIDSQGNVYVIGTRTVRDHRVTPTVTRMESTLYKFTASGGYLWNVPFPVHQNGGATSAAPNIWRYQGNEALIVPVSYPYKVGSGAETRLIAFSPGGQMLADALVSFVSPDLGNSWDDLCAVLLTCFQGNGFTVEASDRPIAEPAPTAAIFTYAGGGTPWIMVADGYENMVAFTFDNNTPTEMFRVTEKHDDIRVFVSTPMVTPDGHTLVSSPSGLRFVGPNMVKVATIKNVHSFSPPTLLKDGRIAVVTDTPGDVAILRNNDTVDGRLPLDSPSVASAASSRNHLFVSTRDALVTFDATTLQEVNRFDWANGGMSPLAIGPQGRVYAIADNKLYVFPAPIKVPVDVATVAQPQQGMVATDPAQPTSQQTSHLFHPPLTTSGNRLFACEELDQDSCGNGDYNTVALAFCQKEGFTQADHLDVDARKVKAETLDGHFCSKNKCKVFDTINCHM
jgi:outer membrane protein assembly factor BamB